MTCEQCRILTDRLERLRAILEEDVASPRGRRVRESRHYPLTEYGRLIAAAATASGTTLRGLSIALGYSEDYIVRVCRGHLKLVSSAARRIGGELEISLGQFVGMGGPRAKGGTA